MVIVGIDIGKFNHQATIIDLQGNIIGKSIKFSNSHAGADKLLKHIQNNTSDTDIIFGLEATGHYWLSIYSFLLDKGYNINVINPIQSDSFRNLYIRQTKNDTVDSFIIAEVIRFGKYTNTKLSDERIMSLRQLCRFRTYLVDEVSELKCKVIAILDQTFPEYEQLFSDIWGTTSKQLLSQYQSPEDIKNIDTAQLAELLSKLSRGQLGYSKAEKIKNAAENTFGINFAMDAFKFQLKQLMDQIIFIEEQIKSLEENIKSIYDSFNCHLTSIPGIGVVLAAVILSEIGDITRFKDSASLVAYAGIDPTVKQSGQYNSNNNKMSKRGSPYLRRAIWMAASCAILYDPVLKEFYNKKRNEGKHHLTAVGAVARKLTYIIFAILRDNKDYVPMA